MANKKGKKDGPPKPRPGFALFARVRPEIGTALQRFIRSKRLRPTITTVLEAALEDFLTREGFPPDPSPEEGDK